MDKSAVIYLSAAVFSACTIAGDSDVAVKLQADARNLRLPNELQSNGAGSLTPRPGGRFGDALLKHGPCTHGSDMYISISLVMQYLGIKEKESKSCHGNVTHWRASSSMSCLIGSTGKSVSKMLFSVYISRQAIKKGHNRSHHIMSFTKEAINLIINVSWRRRLL